MRAALAGLLAAGLLTLPSPAALADHIPEPDRCANLEGVQAPWDRLLTWRWMVRTPEPKDCRDRVGGLVKW